MGFFGDQADRLVRTNWDGPNGATMLAEELFAMSLVPDAKPASAATATTSNDGALPSLNFDFGNNPGLSGGGFVMPAFQGPNGGDLVLPYVYPPAFQFVLPDGTHTLFNPDGTIDQVLPNGTVVNLLPGSGGGGSGNGNTGTPVPTPSGPTPPPVPIPIPFPVPMPPGSGTTPPPGSESKEPARASCPCKVLSGSGSIYIVSLYPNGPNGGVLDIVTAQQLQIDPSETIPAGTWALATQSNNFWFIQVPVWLAPAS